MAVFVAGCGVSVRDGRARLPYGDGRCEVVLNDTLGEEPPHHGGPNPRDHEQTGIICDVWRW